MAIWEHINLRGYFELPPWGLDYMRSYQALSSIIDNYECTITHLEGKTIQFNLTRRMMREALNLTFGEGIDFFKSTYKDKKNNMCFDTTKPIWNEFD